MFPLGTIDRHYFNKRKLLKRRKTLIPEELIIQKNSSRNFRLLTSTTSYVTNIKK